MSIKARPFKIRIAEIEVEGFIDDEAFVFRFFGLPEYRAPILSLGEDARGQFAILQETEIADSDGFVFAVTQEYDEYLVNGVIRFLLNAKKHGEEGRPIHIVCSPKQDFLAIITAYLPSPNEWSGDSRLRLNQ